MEIIHLILGKANPERMNGVNKVVHEMATNQVLQGYSVEVWGITASLLHDYPERNFTTRLFSVCRNPFRFDPELKRALLERKGKIVVHIHGAFLPVFFSISRLLHLEGIPFIITPHSTYNKVMMKKNMVRKKLYFLLFERRLLNRAGAIHLLGKSEWDGLAAIYHNRKSVLIPYGFNRGEGTDGEERSVRDKAEAFTIVYCGRMATYSKGLDILLEGFALFNRQHPDAKLVLIGDGKEKPSLVEKCKALHLDSSVLFTGSIFGEEKIRILKNSHVFAHPSRSDGLPATILEASALGLPCIVTQATNMGEFIERFDAGYTMKNEEPLEFCKGLNVLYRRIWKMGEAGLLRANVLRMIDTDFDWRVILQRFDEIYDRALTFSEKELACGSVPSVRAAGAGKIQGAAGAGQIQTTA